MAKPKKPKSGAEFVRGMLDPENQQQSPDPAPDAPPPDPESPQERMGATLLMGIIDMLRETSKTWDQLSKGQQDAKIGQLRQQVRHLSNQAIRALKAGKYANVVVAIEQMTVKDGAVKLTVTLPVTADGSHDVMDYVDKHGVLVLCNTDQFFKEMDAIEGEDEQKALGLKDKEQPPTPGTVDATVKVGDWVRFKSEAEDGPARQVTVVHGPEAMYPNTVELDGFPGHFAFALFERAEPPPAPSTP